MKTTRQRIPYDVYGNVIQLQKNHQLKKINNAYQIHNGVNTWQIYKIETKPKNKKKVVIWGKMEFVLK